MIRFASFSDLERIVEIYNQSITSGMAVTADTKEVSVESKVDWFHQHESKKLPIWVYDIDDVVAGWLSFNTFYDRPAYDATVELSLYIAAGHQRKGYGRLLVEEALKTAHSFGVETITAFIFAHNKGSLKLFEAYNFEQWGYLPKVAEIDNIKRDLVIIGKKV